MKLLYCKKCKTLFSLSTRYGKHCECENPKDQTFGYYNDKGIPKHTGPHAIPLIIDNNDIKKMLSDKFLENCCLLCHPSESHKK